MELEEVYNENKNRNKKWINIHNFKIDFGEIDPNEKVNGLLGLDFLREAGIIIDLVDLVICTK